MQGRESGAEKDYFEPNFQSVGGLVSEVEAN